MSGHKCCPCVDDLRAEATHQSELRSILETRLAIAAREIHANADVHQDPPSPAKAVQDEIESLDYAVGAAERRAEWFRQLQCKYHGLWLSEVARRTWKEVKP
jgi:hypothetical protein